ncbi:hypothetical protein K7P76_25165 [Cohnella sp. NL03-T5]|uniref:Uncharacterized protein n=1 Tax=Cohnella silvisoli TaxID=2873699 RepID=A0ABV1L0L6_9BACL|nr:hypothetical protein [Cohnella silvisoli]MCD9025106.1 hypothetical protein [Cohnella silvisoli]
MIITVTTGKSQKTSYVIEAAASAVSMRTLVDRFNADQQFTNAEAARP